jgi:hypothetical protein
LIPSISFLLMFILGTETANGGTIISFKEPN